MSYFYDDWRVQPNPDWEQVVIYFSEGTFVDQVVVDTVSFVPEPSTAALGLCALIALARVRMRRGSCP